MFLGRPLLDLTHRIVHYSFFCSFFFVPPIYFDCGPSSLDSTFQIMIFLYFILKLPHVSSNIIQVV